VWRLLGVDARLRRPVPSFGPPATLNVRRNSWFWTAAAFCASFGLAASFVAVFGIPKGVYIALPATARLAFLIFWPAYAGGALVSLFGRVFSPLREHARDLGLAFAAALLVHLGLVACLCVIGPTPGVESFVIFGVAAFFTYLLALLSIKRVRQALPQNLWPPIRFVAMNYIAFAFLLDFAKLPSDDLRNIIKYVPFAALAVAGPALRFAAWAQNQRHTHKSHTLAQPEFERLRNRLCRPGFETFQTLHGGRATGAFTGLRRPAHGRAAAGLAHVQHADRTAASPRDQGVAHPAVYAAGGVVAIGCLTAIGYIAFSAFTVGPTLPPIPSLNSAAEQLGAAANGDRAALSPSAAAPAPPIAAPDRNVDGAPPAILAKAAAPAAPDGAAARSAEQLGAADNGDRAALSPNAAAPAPPGAAPDQNVDGAPPAIQAKAAPAAPDDPAVLSAGQLRAAGNEDGAALSPDAAAISQWLRRNLDVAPPAIPAKAAPTTTGDSTALSAEQLGASGNGDRAALSPNAAAPAPPSAPPDQNVDAAPPAILAKATPTGPGDPTALSAEQPGAAANRDRAALSPNAVAPAPSSAVPEAAFNFFPVATVQNRYNFADRAAPTAPEGAAAHSAEQLGAAGNGDRAALSPNAAPAAPSAPPDQNVDAAPPAIQAKAAPTVPDDPTALSAEQPGAVGNGDRAALSPNAAAPAPPSGPPDQNAEPAPPAILTKAAPTAPDSAAALSAEQLSAASNGDRAALSPNAAAPAPPSAAPDQNVEPAPPALLAKAAPTAPEGAAARVVVGLPTLAPVRVLLSVGRDDSGRARRVADIQRALTAAGVEVSDLVPVDAQQLGPSIGYYFQSDRNAAAELSQLLEPLLGAVNPVALRKRGSIPEPGTIEIAIPSGTTPSTRRGAFLDVRTAPASHGP
jgi:hypothetical protein